MDCATEEVCFADSDDDDYVAFDEQDLNTGIANLYDDDSASDAASDASAPDIDFNELLEEENANDMLFAAPLAAAPPPSAPSSVPQSAQSAVSFLPYPTPIEQSKKEKEKESSSIFNLFSMKKSAPKKNKNKNKKKAKKDKKMNKRGRKQVSKSVRRQSISEDDDDDDDDDEEEREQIMVQKKVRIASKLNKRIDRLRGMQQSQQQRKQKKKVVYKQKVNTNIISIDLGTLATAADNIATGDSYSCKKCQSILSIHDKLLKNYDDIKLDDDDDSSIWICKFCNTLNMIEIDDEEMPKAETVDYILAQPDDDDNKTNDKDKSEEQIIFCIDVSGSMCVTTAVDAKKGMKLKLKGNRLKEDQDALSQFIDPMDRNQWMPKQKQNVQYISRLQCVQSAVDEQIANISETNPNYKIGLVTFNNDVTVIGDGMNKQGSTVITGDKLNNHNKLKEIGEALKINNTVDAAKDKLTESLWNLQETGQTALGPALVVSIAMASSKPGSKVILCTDGLANIGVGSLEATKAKHNDQIESESDDEEEEDDPISKWYDALGDYAMLKGVIVNIISITDDGCKLENLGKLVEKTNGNLKRINPLQLTEKFSGIIENQVIATNCNAKMLLHPAMLFEDTTKNVKIDNDDDEQLKAKSIAKSAKKQKKQKVLEKVPEQEVNKDDKDNKNDAKDDDDVEEPGSDKYNKDRKIYSIPRSTQDVGNVFEASRVFFEYIINKKVVSSFKLLKYLPFQVQIVYDKPDGSKMMRVITQKRLITYDRKKQRKNLNMDILAKYGTKITTELCAKGDYESSRAWTSANTQFMNRNVSYNNKKQLLTLASYANDNIALDHQMKKQQINEVQEEELLYNNNNNNNNNNNMNSFSFRGKKKSKKSKMKNRKGARNDKFANNMYAMKSKSSKK